MIKRLLLVAPRERGWTRRSVFHSSPRRRVAPRERRWTVLPPLLPAARDPDFEAKAADVIGL